VPFGFLRRGDAKPAEAVLPHVDPAKRRGLVPFDGLTEDWRLIGFMEIDGRLSDALNRRESISITDVSWAPVDGSSGFEPAPGLHRLDPYDLVVVLAGERTLPPLSDAEKAAHRIHKVQYDVALDAPPFRIVGTVFLFPGSEPERLLDRSSELFVPVTDAVAFHAGMPIGDPGIDVVLVNRSSIRGVEQVDHLAVDAARTLLRRAASSEPLIGAPEGEAPPDV
jgi:hypothetical protein